MKKILVVGSDSIGRTALTEMLTSKGINDMVIIEAKKEVNPAFEKEPMIFRNTYKDLSPIYNPNPPKRGSNRQPKKKKRKRKR
jgi:hypothetical protein